MSKLRFTTCAFIFSLTVMPFAPPAMAQASMLVGRVSQTSIPASEVRNGNQYGKSEHLTGGNRNRKRPTTSVRIKDKETFFQRHPMIKHAAIGAGVGAAGGAAIGLLTGRGVLRGSLIGAGAGAGVGMVRSSRTLTKHPIARDLATGGLVGLGIGGAARRHGGYVKGAAIGSAAGLGWGLLKYGL